MPASEWWKRGVVYQIYPRSFQDSDGDGIGDLNGIAARLDYLQWLGVGAVWISPVFVSPMADFGYDVADYCDVDPIFGRLADLERLIGEAHARGLRIILDLVPNHTSDRHPWFLESRPSRESSKRDWYIWRDPAPDGGPPNNWISNFGGPMWEWDAATGQYYLHSYLKQQPDLNWRNPDVRAAMFDAMRFWLDRGVDGFRVDVIWRLIKDELFRDNPPNPDWTPRQPEFERFHELYSADRPEVHDVIRQMRAVLDEYDGDRVLIGEIYLPLDRLVAYYGEDLSGAHLPFNFQLLQTPWSAPALRAVIDAYEAALPPGGWPNWVLGNHDRPRIASRAGGEAQARLAAMLLLTLRGSPTLYYGDEIGMPDAPIPPGAVQDPWEKNEPGLGLGRDPVRTPMQWDSSPNAGFTSGRPWLPVAPDYPARNVAAQRADPASILSLYRNLLRLRRASPALVEGAYEPLDLHPDVLAWVRRADEQAFAILLNLGKADVTLDPPPALRGPVLLSTLPGAMEAAGAPLRLRADEGLILDVTARGVSPSA